MRNLWLALVALIAGFLLTFWGAGALPSITARYMAIAILAVMDSAMGALRASLRGEYDRTLFLSGLFMNAAGAALLVWLGDQLGVDLYLAAVFAFGYRIFQNLGAIRSTLVLRWRQWKIRRQREALKEAVLAPLGTPAADEASPPPEGEDRATG